MRSDERNPPIVHEDGSTVSNLERTTGERGCADHRRADRCVVDEKLIEGQVGWHAPGREVGALLAPVGVDHERIGVDGAQGG